MKKLSLKASCVGADECLFVSIKEFVAEDRPSRAIDISFKPLLI